MHFVRLCFYWIFYIAFISLTCSLINVNACLECGGEDPVSENKNTEPVTYGADTSGSTTETSDEQAAGVEDEQVPETQESPSLKEYKKYFLLHRSKQLDAVKSLALLQNNEQRNKLVEIMLKQLFVTIGDARENLTVAGYLPGDPFPDDEEVRESMSKVLENTAIFGDLILFMPELVHSMYDKEKEWQVLLAWSYGFSTQSGVYEGNFQTMLNLMAMESNIIPKEKDFINPFKSLAQLQSLVDGLKKDEQKNKTKKPKRKIERGPKLRKTEL